MHAILQFLIKIYLDPFGPLTLVPLLSAHFDCFPSYNKSMKSVINNIYTSKILWIWGPGNKIGPQTPRNWICPHVYLCRSKSWWIVPQNISLEWDKSFESLNIENCNCNFFFLSSPSDKESQLKCNHTWYLAVLIKEGQQMNKSKHVSKHFLTYVVFNPSFNRFQDRMEKKT